jgi:integral membrane sensor domain MASE1
MSGMSLPSSSKVVERVNRADHYESLAASNRILSIVSAALLVGISYYVGTRIGFAWTPGGWPNSTFWPPNAILLAALLLIPRRAWWWMFFLAVLPAHMFAQLQIGVPFWTAAGWFISNSFEAFIGAYCIIKFSDSGRRLDSVRGVFVFVVFGVLVAPLATSFLDAADVVITGWGRDYWHLGMQRFFTNALAVLTIVPPIVLCGSKGISWIREISVARWAEAALLAIATVLFSICIYGPMRPSPATTPAVLYLPLPLLLWAAARFGLAGLSLSLLTLALISTWYATHGLLPFPYASLPQNILSLQILFCPIAVALMFLSAVMAAGRRTQESLLSMSGNLVMAQEQERHRIARELHDNLGQELALVEITLDRLLGKCDSSLKLDLTDLSSRVSAISETAHEISHGLYPTTLEYLGLKKAMKKLCDELQRGKELSIDFTIGNLPDQLQPSTSVSLYRVVQEALHNIITHSHARNVKVELTSRDGRILLLIMDDGVGFDVSHEEVGLGLVSMRERIRAIGGSIHISSFRKEGTLIEVQVPLHEAGPDDTLTLASA